MLSEHSGSVPSVAEGGWLPLTERQQRDVVIQSAHAAAAAFAAAGYKWSGPWNGGGWDEGYVPTEAEIALRLTELVDGVQMGSGSRTGRFCVERYIEDGRECLDVTLQLGTAYGEEPKQP